MRRKSVGRSQATRCKLGRKLLGACLALAAFSYGNVAQAQDRGFFCGPDGEGPVRGTVGYNLLFGAINTNASAFGATALVENHLLPELNVNEGAAHYTVTYIPAAVRIPKCEPDGGLRMQKVDLSGGAFGAGANVGPLHLFFAGSATTHDFRSDKWNETTAAPFLGAGFTLGAPVAFFKRQFVRDDLSVTFDAMLGAQLSDDDIGDITLAYVGSQGLYTNLSERHVRAFLGLLYGAAKDQAEDLAEEQAQNLFDRFPYLRAGFSDLDWLVGSAREWVGTTSVFARRLRYDGIPAATVDREDLQDTSTQTVDFATAHLEQYQIAHIVDVFLAGAWEPKPFLHEASIGLSLGMTQPEQIVLDRVRREGIQTDHGGDFFGFRAAVGMVRMPDLWYYGVAGGQLFRFTMDISMGGYDDENKSYNMFFLTVGMNSPETLALFPYATNSGYMKMSGAFVF